MPSATSRTSASTVSHRLAIAFMNEILVARKALDAYLIISADAGSVTSIGALIERYSSLTRTATAGSSQPMTTRLGSRKSRTEVPSRRNSGFEATPTCSIAAPASARMRCTSRVEPTGIVDLLMTTVPACSTGAISRATSSTNERSAEPSSAWGVGTQRNTNSAMLAAFFAPTTKRSRCDDRPSCTSAASPSSRIGISPFDSAATRSASMSAHVTRWPR